MFGFLRKKPSAEDQPHMAGEYATVPMNNRMVMLFAEELPMLDSTSRRRVNALLKEYDDPVIESVEDLPAEIRELMDL